jgi:hypothetical protein
MGEGTYKEPSSSVSHVNTIVHLDLMVLINKFAMYRI